MTEGTAKNGLFYTEEGDGNPLIMLHGGGPGASGVSNFGANLPVFAERFRTLLVDQPGYGRSVKPERFEKQFFTAAAAAVVELMDELGIDKAHVLGNSLGGGTAARMAINHPDRVDRLVLMGPGGVSLNVLAADPTEGIRRLFEFSAGPTRESLVAFLTALAHDPALVTEDLIAKRLASATDPETVRGNAAMAATFANPAMAEEGMLWREAYKIRHETLLTWGREDRVNPLDGALVALKTIPNARLHVFPHCGHWAQTERFDEFNRVALNFLES
ncbi:2-hydroxy-6-oxo-6-phenylhexa-2,4-dienoate hydrolase [Streptomyces sp. L-9-10]|uniref:4,5:9,10-diseco-3-hydroxy-5,9, 17-trioxoandrosta-1(10),2-diene-4-oate hydrolase n=1 Tax=Streptomyces sp. L-9-10 TaxID=1478131 RepID=UPI0010E1E768|nr:4,5:9,10-diseco-3-hydroxy-5,9,17-trioxoandrosta-1(10),2-diene-4-oate hydrolase [Streptomyces sp. L-9-10]RYJ25763.1 2-hydroxy-6-oxo-6-phenylhexa-2,4-dienoate hydrolase [Streptomyces sp. L-9-10]